MLWLLILCSYLLYLMYNRTGRKTDALWKKIPSGLARWPVIGHAYLFLGGKEEICPRNKKFHTNFYPLRAGSDIDACLSCIGAGEIVKDTWNLVTFKYKLTSMIDGLKKLGLDAIDRGGISTFWLGNMLMGMVSDPITAEVLLKNCLEKEALSAHCIRFFIGNGSLQAPVPVWRRRRKHLAPAFSMKRLNQFVDVFADQSRILVEQLKPSVGRESFPVWMYLTSFTFDSVCQTTLGVCMNAQVNHNHPILVVFDKITDLMSQRLLKPWQQPDWLYRFQPQYREALRSRSTMVGLIDQIIATKRKEIELSQRKPDNIGTTDLEFKSLIEMMLETSMKSEGFSDVALREEVMVMSAAGTDTSATGAGFALALLARHPEVQEKVVEELIEVLGCGDHPVTATDLPKLKYLEAVIKESLRLYPPVPIIARATSKDFELQSAIVLPEGTGFMVNIWAIHHNPRYWGPDVEDFRPERFLSPLVHPEQFIPFSYGLRNCLGYQYAMMSMKTVLATILRHYQVLPPAGMDPKTLKEPIRVNYGIMMKAVDDFQIQIKNRELIEK